jgi:hypothetical protein
MAKRVQRSTTGARQGYKGSHTGKMTVTEGLVVDEGTKTASATAGAATLSKYSGKITSEALTTAQNAIYTLTLTNTKIAAADIVLASVANGTNTQGTPMVGAVTAAAGSVVILIINKHATAQAFNGTIVVSFVVVKAS